MVLHSSVNALKKQRLLHKAKQSPPKLTLLRLASLLIGLEELKFRKRVFFLFVCLFVCFVSGCHLVLDWNTLGEGVFVVFASISKLVNRAPRRLAFFLEDSRFPTLRWVT